MLTKLHDLFTNLNFSSINVGCTDNSGADGVNSIPNNYTECPIGISGGSYCAYDSSTTKRQQTCYRRGLGNKSSKYFPYRCVGSSAPYSEPAGAGG